MIVHRALKSALVATAAVAACLTVAPASAQAAESSESPCKGMPDQNVAHPYDRRAYLSCVDEQLWLTYCPEGLHYNPNKARPLGVCEDPRSIKEG
ncbi:carbohydrate-binding module family 14 protein [Streptomyces gobiensis]|uniref:carbohydrate-binding module family 14 protein n=1 Tax=Streptomyces gobiensis TaxID=2875706 RepID=UPI001E4CC7EB|nr:carbohydrate-binding module family 14 protein [Streptomyces gobiensis]UGY92842.1 carbohydrate-binding module family 14 protein [Streptomyces gobiensis]